MYYSIVHTRHIHSSDMYIHVYSRCVGFQMNWAAAALAAPPFRQRSLSAAALAAPPFRQSSLSQLESIEGTFYSRTSSAKYQRAASLDHNLSGATHLHRRDAGPLPAGPEHKRMGLSQAPGPGSSRCHAPAFPSSTSSYSGMIVIGALATCGPWHGGRAPRAAPGGLPAGSACGHQVLGGASRLQA
jgi:hypothetical protein